MELIEKIFKPLLLIAAAVWIVMAALHILTTEQLLVFLGGMAIVMAVRNLIILNISAKTGHYHAKIQNYVDRYGKQKGLMYYAIMLVLFYLVFGCILIGINM